MAKGGFGEIIVLGGVAVGAYFLWQWWTTQTASAAAQTSTTGTTAAQQAAGAYTPPTAQQTIQALANTNSIIQAQNGQGDAYQWATLWNEAGYPSIGDINTIFFPSGLPANAAAVTAAGGTPSQGGLPLMSLATFLAGVKASGISVQGMSGLGAGPMTIPVPVMLLPGQRTIMNVPAGTTPAELQRQLRRAG